MMVSLQELKRKFILKIDPDKKVCSSEIKLRQFGSIIWDVVSQISLANQNNVTLDVQGLYLDMNLKRPTVIRILGVLESIGVVKRRRSKSDSRRVVLELSTHGATAFSQVLHDLKSLIEGRTKSEIGCR